MKKNIGFCLLCACVLFSISFVSAEVFEENYSSYSTYKTSSIAPHIEVTSLKYDPYPVNPGEYVTLWIQAENLGTGPTPKLIFELMPAYPFSLDDNENPTREYGTLAPDEPVVLEYKVRVDVNAVDGPNELKIRYSVQGDDNNWVYKEFDITLEDAQTDFDLVVQETDGTTVTLAIANTGMNYANSVIVRLPEQEYFKASGTNGQMVGNLEDGDYTLVSFDITQKNSKATGDTLPLLIQIDYTDSIGERRIVLKEIAYPSSSAGVILGQNQTAQNTPPSFRGTSANFTGPVSEKSLLQQWWFWGILLAIGYAGWKGFSLYKKRKESHDEKGPKK